MPTLPLPVVFVRWFREGVGYGYNSEIDERLLKTIYQALAPVRESTHEAGFRLPLPDGRLLVGTKDPDAAPLDPKAEGREPYIIRGTVVPPDVRPDQEQDILKQLAGLDPPAAPGLSPSLAVHLVPPSAPPVVPIPWRQRTQPILWFLLAAVLLVADIVITVSEDARAPWGLAFRGLLLFGVLIAAVVVRKMLPTAEQVSALEWQWYTDAEPPPGTELRIRGYVITPDGRETHRPDQPTLRSTGISRIPRSPVTYRFVQVQRGAVLLSGEELMSLGGEPVSAAFIRIYVREQRAWRVRHAQWTTRMATSMNPAVSANVRDGTPALTPPLARRTGTIRD
jgi:hypothetical protein